MIYLIFSLIALGSGPLILYLVKDRPGWNRLIDGFIFITISGLVILHIMPDAIEQGGWVSLLCVLLGVLGPSFSEKVLHHKVNQAHRIALVLGILGIVLHAGVDGTSLSLSGHHAGHAEHTSDLLALAVILHRIPVSLTLWWLIQPYFGRARATLVLVVLGLVTIGGFLTGPALLQHASLAWFQAFVAGSLLHVVMHKGHHHDGHSESGSWQSGLGNALGIALLIFLGRDHHIIEDSIMAAQALETFLKMALETAPALLLAYVLAGFTSVLMSPRAVNWLSRGNTWSQAAKGMAVGLPLPVCSCGTIPLYRSMIEKGAPAAAAMAFFIATPELGIDAVLVSLPLLGVELTLWRLLAASLIALLVGGLLGPFIRTHLKKDSCPCCGSDPKENLTVFDQVKKGLGVGLIDLVDHTSPWIILGLIVAAFAAPLLNVDSFSWIPSGLEVPLFALLGLPVYVCATGATPIVAVLLWNHISPGAAIAFLVTGPATNVSTFGVLSNLHGKKAALGFGAMTLAFSVLAGFFVNLVAPNFQPQMPHPTAPEAYSWFSWASLSILGVLVSLSFLKRGARHFLAELVPRGEG